MYGRGGEACDRCLGPIAKTRAGGRGTWFAPSVRRQRSNRAQRGRPLACCPEPRYGKSVATEAVHDQGTGAYIGTAKQAPSSPAVINAVDITRAFGDKQALDGVTFRVGAGQIHALLGPNGAGKTTLLRILTGLLHADSGSVRTAGFDPVDNPRGLRERVGLVPSGDRTFYFRLSGLDNLTFFGRLYGLRRGEAVARARDLMAKVGLEDALKVSVGVYSHGMQKRLSVARALLANPSVLLLSMRQRTILIPKAQLVCVSWLPVWRQPGSRWYGRRSASRRSADSLITSRC